MIRPEMFHLVFYVKKQKHKVFIQLPVRVMFSIINPLNRFLMRVMYLKLKGIFSVYFMKTIVFKVCNLLRT